MKKLQTLIPLLTLLGASPLTAQDDVRRPNVIIVLTDDQGYGDMSCHGNPDLQTPNIDSLSRDGVRFSRFFVSPLCQPTRSSLMTGRNKVIGRRIEPDEQTLPQMFRRGGYATAIFGKWHLGEYRPFRPVDKGFDEQLLIGAGAIGQVEDYWGNDNFDTWFRNTRDEWVRTKGYCTDVLFDRAADWMKSQAVANKPFFCYLATNAPHTPHSAPESYLKPFLDRGLPPRLATFYAMIANIDDNLGKLRRRLGEMGVERDTLLVFMTDNGSVMGSPDPAQASPHNAGMRGAKGSVYEGGSRSAVFFVWPGTLEKGREIDQLTMHYDILPTMSELCGIPLLTGPGVATLDGRSFKDVLMGAPPRHPVRHHVIYQGFWPPDKPLSRYENTSIRSNHHRLANGGELYDLRTDPSESENIIASHPAIAADLRKAYDAWWEKNSGELPDLRVDKAYPLGATPGETFTMNALFYYDSAILPDARKWYDSKFFQQDGLRRILTDEASPKPRQKPLMGRWKIDFQAAGEYRFVFRKGPREAPAALTEIRPGKAHVALGDERTQADITQPAREFGLNVKVERPGIQMVECWFEGQRADGSPSGAYFVDITRLE